MMERIKMLEPECDTIYVNVMDRYINIMFWVMILTRLIPKTRLLL